MSCTPEIVLALFSLLIGSGLQVSGYTNQWLAAFFFIAAVLLGLHWAFPHIQETAQRWARRYGFQFRRPWERTAMRPASSLQVVVPTEPFCAATAKPKYTRAGLEGRLQALARIRDVVERLTDDFHALRKPIFGEWPAEWPKIGPKGYVKRAEEMRNRLERAQHDMSAVLQKIDYAELKGMPWSEWKTPPALILRLNVWIETVAVLPPGVERPPINTAAWNLYVEAINKIESWINQTREQIAAKRTEYETADHQ
jgi:hypothetical protein